MTKDTIMIFVITIAVVAGAIFVLYYNTYKPMSNEGGNQVLTEEEKEELAENIESPVQLTPFEAARYVTVEKVILTTTEDAKGNFETAYDTYLVSDIDLESKTDVTEHS